MHRKIENVEDRECMHAKSRELASIGMETRNSHLKIYSAYLAYWKESNLDESSVEYISIISTTGPRKVAESLPDGFSTRVIMDSAYQ